MSAKRLFFEGGGSLISSNGCLWAVGILTLTCTVLQAAAPEFESDKVDEKAGRNKAIAQQCVKDPATYAANQDKFNEYFLNYHFPAMTQTEPEKLAKLGGLREDIFKYYLWKTTNAQLQQDLTKMAGRAMWKIVQNPAAHPASRYNAILVIGMLDEQYSDGRQPPKPLPSANAALLVVLNSATTGNQFPPAIILGALIGLERHAQFRESLPAESVKSMTAALLKLVAHDVPIQEMDRAAYAWIRLRAASVLAKLGSVGDSNAVHNALVKLIASSKSLDDRCEVAGLLGKLIYKDAKLDEAAVEPLFALARDLGAVEDKRAQDFQEQGGAPGGARPGFPGGPGNFPGGVAGEEETYPRRQVLSRLTALRNGLKAVKPALAAETQKKVDDLLKAIEPARAAAASKETVELKLAESIRTMALAINTAVPPAAKAGAEKAADTL